jgi:peptidoglycan/LPS O-acetylase OafA/YrhL
VYLTHLICIWLTFEYLRDLPLPLRWTVFLASVVALPVGLYHALEHPMILLGGQLAAKLPSSRTRAPALSR